MFRLVLASGLLLILTLSACDLRVQGHQVDKSSRTDLEAPAIYDADGYLLDGAEDKFEYKIGDSDVLDITIYRHEELSGLLTVDSDGYIEVPVVHERVSALNKTTKALEAEIGWAVQKYLKREAQVYVTVDKVNSKQYLVLADAASGGADLYKMDAHELRLRDAVIEAGLHASNDVNLAQVYVIRPDRRHPTYVIVDVEQVLMGRMQDNLRIQPDDIIYVPTKLGKKVDDVIDYISHRVSQYINLDTDFQQVEDMLPRRSKDSSGVVTRRNR